MYEPMVTCMMCEAEYTQKEANTALTCFNCGSTTLPYDPHYKATITLPIHFLRILCVWSENYASHCDSVAAIEKLTNHTSFLKTHSKIIKFIETQIDKEKKAKLTLAEEHESLEEWLGLNIPAIVNSKS